MDGGTTALKPSLSLDELEAQITELAGQLNAATYRWLTLIAEFDRREGWADGKEGACRPFACRLAEDRSLHGARRIELFESAGGVEGRLPGHRRDIADDRPAWHGPSCGALGARLSACARGRGAVARGASTRESRPELLVRGGRQLGNPRPDAGGRRRAVYQGARGGSRNDSGE